MKRTPLRLTLGLMMTLIACLANTSRPAVAGRLVQPDADLVVSAELRADTGDALGACPRTVKFTGSITTKGPGNVRYTFVRSDGATGPEFTLNFDQAATREVNTTWTLGDAVALPHYEGWQSIRIISPNTFESERARFVLDCKAGATSLKSEPEAIAFPVPPRPLPNKPPAENQAGMSSADYLRIWPKITAESMSKFASQLAILKSFASRSRPGLSEAAAAAAGYDPQTALADYREIGEERDSSKRADKQARFDAQYSPLVLTVSRNANVDLQKERDSLLTELNLDNVIRQARSVLVIETGPQPDQPRPPSSEEIVFTSPWDFRGGFGDQSTANQQGNLTLLTASYGAFEQHHFAFVGRSFPVESGVGRVRVSATFAPVTFDLRAVSTFAGYSSVEAFVNLRIMEGDRVIETQHVSLGREIAVIFGWAEREDSRPITLALEINRRGPQAATTLTAVAEIEAIAGAGGLAGSRVWMQAFVRDIRIAKDR